MRGVESRGMLCSAKELGIDEDASGLLPLDPSLAPGTPLREALDLDDTLITLKITPNRADCLSVAGIAQDVAAITRSPLQASASGRDARSRSTASGPCASTIRERVPAFAGA